MVIKIFSSIYDCKNIEMNIFHWHIIILKMLQPIFITLYCNMGKYLTSCI